MSSFAFLEQLWVARYVILSGLGTTVSISLLAIVVGSLLGVFVGIAQTLNYQLFRRLAGYDPPTAYYCATPGGLIEAVQLGEEAGGNVGLLTVQHYSRVALTVTLVPLI